MYASPANPTAAMPISTPTSSPVGLITMSKITSVSTT
jgi:hypothetical protein